MFRIGGLHQQFVFSRRARVLATELGTAIPPDTRTVLDIGCGEGTIDMLLGGQRPELEITGVDVLVRPQARIPVTPFDGESLPFPTNSVDVALFVDVLHHTRDPEVLLREAHRVARKAVVLKDHTLEGLLAYRTLAFMDWVGNAHHGVALPNNYWTRSRWLQAFASIGLNLRSWNGRLPLYPWPASWIFGRDLHFVALLDVCGGAAQITGAGVDRIMA